MRDVKSFRSYLENDFTSSKTGHSLKPKIARDIVSRCIRVERSLRIDLSEVLRADSASLELLEEKIRQNTDKFNYQGRMPYFYNLLTAAIRYYHKFLCYKFSNRPKRR